MELRFQRSVKVLEFLMSNVDRSRIGIRVVPVKSAQEIKNELL